MDAYFRQTWLDTRLRFTGPIKEMAVGIKVKVMKVTNTQKYQSETKNELILNKEIL